MPSKLFIALAQAIHEKGEREQVDEQRVITMSELTLIVNASTKPSAPRAILFQLFGMDFVMLPDGTVSFASPDADDEYFDLSDSKTRASVEKFLAWRLEALRDITL